MPVRWKRYANAAAAFGQEGNPRGIGEAAYATKNAVLSSDEFHGAERRKEIRLLYLKKSSFPPAFEQEFGLLVTRLWKQGVDNLLEQLVVPVWPEIST